VDEAAMVLPSVLRCAALCVMAFSAFTIRLHAVQNYGRVIHEFDPWFNYRATEYLVDNGREAFFKWYDEMSWYPLGRPIGTTIYPGLQFTSAALYHVSGRLGLGLSLNDICVFVPAIFGVITCVFTYLLTLEISGSPNSAVAAGMIMAVIPSHLMRSVAGGYDNESIAVFAMIMTFYFWTRSLRTPASWPVGFFTAFSYIYMVAAWGGYVFVLNLVGVHALVMCLLLWQKDCSGLHLAYSLFYVIGTFGAIQLPVVGLAPLKSLEQLGPMGVFLLLQLLRVLQWHRTRSDPRKHRQFTTTLLVATATVGVAVLAWAAQVGYLGPISSRVRGLFIRHTRTGNPLVDSVAEHQSTRPQMYYVYFHFTCYAAPVGFLIMCFRRTPAKVFGIVYLCVTYYFSSKMVRLVLLLAAPASIAAGIALAMGVDWALTQLKGKGELSLEDAPPTPPEKPSKSVNAMPGASAKKALQKRAGARKSAGSASDSSAKFRRELKQTYNENKALRQICALLLLFFVVLNVVSFSSHCRRLAVSLSNPSIILKGRTRTGEPILVDDFREAYWWLRDSTPEDARVLSWWDYGYQINGIANRTTIADGNTWNHEHIALLGKALVSPVADAHTIVRHLADYVLVWSTRWGGMMGDDIAKSPHMAKIGGSVYTDVLARDFFMTRDGQPSTMMRESLIYNLVNYRLDVQVPSTGFRSDPDVAVADEHLFEEAYTTKNNMVRIYKVLHVSEESKAYCSEHRGYQAWYEGRPLTDAYPPALQSILAQKRDFQQLEDFNRRGSK